MVVTNNDITSKTYKKLSIQVSLSGLSFCVFDLLQNKAISFGEFVFQENQVIEEQLWKAFSEFPILRSQFDSVSVLHNNTLNTFVPHSLFNEAFLGSYLQYNVKVFESDLFAHDDLKNQEIHNVYVPYVNINNFLLDQYSSFNYSHVATILVEKLLEESKFNINKEVFIHIDKNFFQIVVVQAGKLLFYNSFEPSTAEDFIYYTLFTLEQLQLNPDSCMVSLFGHVNKDHSYYKIAYKFIRNCHLLDVHDLADKFKINKKQARENYILLHS